MTTHEQRMVDFGQQVKAERNLQGRSQAWVAEQTGLNRKTVLDLECGRNVTLQAISQILTALNLNLQVSADKNK